MPRLNEVSGNVKRLAWGGVLSHAIDYTQLKKNPKLLTHANISDRFSLLQYCLSSLLGLPLPIFFVLPKWLESWGLGFGVLCSGLEHNAAARLRGQAHAHSPNPPTCLKPSFLSLEGSGSALEFFQGFICLENKPARPNACTMGYTKKEFHALKGSYALKQPKKD